MVRKTRGNCPRTPRTRSPGAPWRRRVRCPVTHVTEARDGLFNLAAGSGRTRAEPVSTRDAVAGEPPACWATSACLGRNSMSVPDTPSLLASHDRCRPILARKPFPKWHTVRAVRNHLVNFMMHYGPPGRSGRGPNAPRPQPRDITSFVAQTGMNRAPECLGRMIKRCCGGGRGQPWAGQGSRFPGTAPGTGRICS